MTAPFCPTVRDELEMDSRCIRNHFQGVIFNGGCMPSGSSVTITFSGSGLWNGTPNYTFTGTVTDDTPDGYAIDIFDPFGAPSTP